MSRIKHALYRLRSHITAARSHVEEWCFPLTHYFRHWSVSPRLRSIRAFSALARGRQRLAHGAWQALSIVRLQGVRTLDRLRVRLDRVPPLFTLNRGAKRAFALLSQGASLALAGVLAVAFRLYNRWSVVCRQLGPRYLQACHKLSSLFVSGRTGVSGKIGALTMAGLFAIIIGSSYYYNVALAVTIDGEFAGYVHSQDELDAIIQEVEEYSSEILGEEYKLRAQVDSSISLVSQSRLLSPKDAQSLLQSTVSEIETLAVVRVDGEMIGAVQSPEIAEQVRDLYIQRYAGDFEDAQAELMEPFTIDVEDVDTQYQMDAEQLTQALSSVVQPAVTHTIRSGDTIASICEAYGLQQTALASMNPVLQSAPLPEEGQQLIVSPALLRLNVKVTRPIAYTEQIAYESVETENPDLAKGTRNVTQAGQKGEAAVEATLVTLNGVEQERDILSRTVTRQPVNELIDVGTKVISAQSSGWMSLPYNGRLSSNYGYRWGSFHRGLDLAGPTGSTVRAAAAGKVVMSGWNGSYGYCVIISHGDGVESVYGHNSSLLVSVGESVSQGQAIARVGSTGRSTGPHCHFEVRVNGDYVNPWKYLS